MTGTPTESLDAASTRLDEAQRRFDAAKAFQERVNIPVVNGLIDMVVEHRRNVAGRSYFAAEVISEQHENMVAQLAAYTAEQQAQLEPPQVD